MKRSKGSPADHSVINGDLLRELVLEDVGLDESSYVTSDMTTLDAAKHSLCNALLKKFRGSEKADAAQAAIVKFKHYNAKCATFILEPKRFGDDLIINEVKSLLDDWLHPDGVPLTLADFASHAMVGGGSSIGVDKNDFYTKLFDSTLSSYDASNYQFYLAAISGNPTWRAAENRRLKQHGNLVVGASKLSTVRKEIAIRRTICSEAVLDMFFQLGIGGALEQILWKRLSINFDRKELPSRGESIAVREVIPQPEKNQEYARLGSLGSDHCTIDLRSASDCIALHGLIRQVFPPYFVRWLERFRAKAVRLPSGETEELHMLSTMGNGYTFPLQTMLFAAIVVACYRLTGIRPHSRETRLDCLEQNNFGVFGDDIVVCKSAYSIVVHALSLFGFEVNDSKSFESGDFRESCGKDYFRGVNIRGVYVKYLRNDSDLYSVMNRLVRWSATHGVELGLSLQYILSGLRGRLLLIPRHEDDAAGLCSPLSVAQPDFWCFATRIPYYRCLVARTRSWAFPTDDGPERRKARRAKNKSKQSQKDKRRFVPNYDGAIVSLVGGFMRDGKFGIRSDPDAPSRPKVLQRLTPNWDQPKAGDASRDDIWQDIILGLRKEAERVDQ